MRTVLLLVLTLPLFGQLTDTSIHPMPSTAPTLPAALGKFTDPTFGTTIMRLTGVADGTNCNHMYSYWPVFSRDNQRLHVACDGTNILYDFSAATFTASNKRAMSVPFDSQDSIWADTGNLHVLYGHDGTTLYSYNVDTTALTTIRDFTSNSCVLSQMSKSQDDDVFFFGCYNSGQSSQAGYLVWRRSTNTILTQRDLWATSGITMDEGEVDKSGQWFVLKETTGTVIVNVSTLAEVHPTQGLGHSGNGNGVVAGLEFDTWNGASFRSFATPNTVNPLVTYSWTQDGHLSQMIDGDKWTLMSTYSGNYGDDTATGGTTWDASMLDSGSVRPYCVYCDEEFLIRTDGSGAVLRLAHSRTDAGSPAWMAADADTSYWAQPRGAISRDGEWAVFTSDWESKTRNDVFIVKTNLSLIYPGTTSTNTGFTIQNPYRGTDGTGPYANWYGIVSHTHGPATGSTGTLAQLFSDAADLGISIVPICDKRMVTADPGSHTGTTYLPCYEDTTGNPYTPHIVCIGCTSWSERTGGNPFQNAIVNSHNQSSLVILAHPSFNSAILPGDLGGLSSFDGIEVYNGQGYNGFDVWDAGLFAGRRLIGAAGNDLYYRGYRAVMWVNSPTGAPSDILANLRAGNFYGTHSDTLGGPFQGLRVTQVGNTLTATLRTSEADPTPPGGTINWYCGKPTAGSVCGTGASYTVLGDEKYVWAMKGDRSWGDHIWSQAIYVVPSPVRPTVAPSAQISAGTVH